MNKYSFITAVCALLVLFLSVLNYCERREPQGQTVTVSKTDTIFFKDTSKHAAVSYNLYSTAVHTVAPGSKIDTAEIIKLFFTKRFVVDSLQDSLIKIKIVDTLFNNQISYRKKQYELLKPYQKQITTSYTTTLQAPVKKGIYAGPFFSFGKDYLQAAGVEANYTTHKFNYGIGYDFKNKAVQGKVLFRIN